MNELFKFITPENFAIIVALVLLFKTTNAIEGLSKNLTITCNNLTDVLNALRTLCNDTNRRVIRLETFMDVTNRLREIKNGNGDPKVADKAVSA
jgi:hypothetical protein